MYSCHLLLWPYHEQCLHSYASTEDGLQIASSRFELLRMYSADLFYAYSYVLRTRWTRQSAICARKNRPHVITGLCHRQPSNNNNILSLIPRKLAYVYDQMHVWFGCSVCRFANKWRCEDIDQILLHFYSELTADSSLLVSGEMYSSPVEALNLCITHRYFVLIWCITQLYSHFSVV